MPLATKTAMVIIGRTMHPVNTYTKLLPQLAADRVIACRAHSTGFAIHSLRAKFLTFIAIPRLQNTKKTPLFRGGQFCLSRQENE